MKKIIEEKPEDLKEKKKSAKDGSVKGQKKEGVKKRRKAKKQDKMARWSGMILFVILLIIGFLMWVAGEVKTTPTIKPSSQSRVVPSLTPSVPESGRVVVE